MPDLHSNSRKVLFDEVDELPDKIDDLITAVDESDERKINTNKLKIDTDELKVGTDELKINTRLNTNKPKLDPFDRLDELLRTVEKYDLTTFRRVHFIYGFGRDTDIDKLELRMARFLSSLPHVQTLLIDGWPLKGQLLQRTIVEGTLMPFRELKTVIWGTHLNPLDELLSLWGFSVEHIEVIAAEPVVKSHKHWPAPTSSLRKLNLHHSTITYRTLANLLNLSPRLEFFRYEHLCNVDSEWSSWWSMTSLTNSDPRKWHDCLLLMKALQKVQQTLMELDIGVEIYSDIDHEVECLDVRPIRGQLSSMRGFSRLRKLKAPIVMLLGWSPGDLPLRQGLAEVVPAGLTHLGLSEDLAMQYTYEWTEELVLEELEVFLSVWRTVTPNLQVVEVWLYRDCGRWERKKVVQLQMMCEEAGVSCNVHLQMECDGLWRMEACSVPMWVMQGPWPRREKALPTVEHIRPF
ncbi:hypothetical protein V8E54_002425 [Elaphomyces granulatus]